MASRSLPFLFTIVAIILGVIVLYVGLRMIGVSNDTIRTLASLISALVIPATLFWVGQNLSKRRNTIDLIKSLTTTPEIMSRMQRLYEFRKYSEGTGTADPYTGDTQKLIYDHVVVLNFFEGVCREIEDKQVDERLIYVSSSNTIVGVRRVLLRRLNTLLQEDQDKDYEALIRVSNRFIQQADERHETIQYKIPDRQQADTPPPPPNRG
ncbi:hypothetical protein PB2503_06957 [Parvularcula bermudensis HTCC2503]|uniref:Uncharacterized protein n=1 Tax=Parvularcula bermudensis (strain ATCC BAA-594 / HTCC2503 / KCTC 12087) TaxID=314260 RepID=E0TE82_PARBH|nr:hypothetical protein [Parvularcula bermudensis]ADM09457.1 hypothetical protein PB2503_06957 [Parvularcula bermudensis HTCC2503]